MSVNKKSISEMTPNEKRRKINSVCFHIPMIDGKCNCPFDEDVGCWCHIGKIADVPDDQLDEILKKLEGIRHA